ncbi:MAG TPA: molybdenum cofactor biosynthesis protein MoaE [Mycobacteriales bacterium]|nr:molybdenum cofactor biosynthesis protein MoaE [Mycobacteriales bacterium]
MTARTAHVITASTRAANGVYPDRGGPIVVAELSALGFTVGEPTVVADGPDVEQVLRDAVAAGYDVVITTGGTGLNPTDTTPEATRAVIDAEVPGIAEALRAAGRASVPTAALSRGIAGRAGATLVVNLPGSPGGVRDGMAVLAPLLSHAVEQLHGTSDHPAHDHSTSGDPCDMSPGIGPISHGSRAVGHAHDRPDGVVGDVLRATVTDEAVSVAEHEELVSRAAAGAVVGFGGAVRDHDHGRTVTLLEYTAHPDAAAVLAEVAADAAQRPGVLAVAVTHRLGELKIGDVALACAVSAAHRAEAFAACGYLVDEVKRRIPVWKRQVFDDGTDEWVNCA